MGTVREGGGGVRGVRGLLVTHHPAHHPLDEEAETDQFWTSVCGYLILINLQTSLLSSLF